MPTKERSRSIWNVRTVAWYQRANERSDYAEKFLGAIWDLLARSRTALDVGAGFGALALPLARVMEHVTAVEPAPAMAAALRDAVTGARLENVTVIAAGWDGVRVSAHDLVVCSHVSHLLGPGAPFLTALARGDIAKRGVALVRDAPGGDDKFFFGELYPILLGRPYAKSCGFEETEEALARFGVKPKLTTIEYGSDQPFDSLDEACDFWVEYMGLEGPEPRAYLRGFLGARLRHEGDLWIAPFRKRAVVIHWTVE